MTEFKTLRNSSQVYSMVSTGNRKRKEIPRNLCKINKFLIGTKFVPAYIDVLPRRKNRT